MAGAIIASMAASPAAAGALVTDVAVTRATANVASASTGDKIVFRGFAKDLGPDPVTDSLDIHFEGKAHISIGHVSCRQPGQGEVVSNDGNYCEFGPAAVGERFVERVRATVTSDEGNAKLTFCASTESATPTDPNPANDCQTVKVATPA
jgi:Domain of unknown function DUF11